MENKPAPVIVEQGQVLSVADGVLKVAGLSNVMMGELVMLNKARPLYGIALTLSTDSVSIALFGNDRAVVEGDTVIRTKGPVVIGRGVDVLGRIMNSLGEPIDTNLPIIADDYGDIDVKAPGIIDRQSVNEPLQTGILPVDSMIPIGKGQRELIIGDRQTGKTTIAIDTILNQRSLHLQDDDDKVFCIYVAIGQKRSSVAQLTHRLKA